MNRRAAALLPCAVFLLLTAVSWKRWIEPYVDTGRELMVPWRVAQGEALYRDVRFYYGPLAPWLAAAVDLVTGRSFAARIALAAIVAILHLEALRRLAGRILPGWRAALITSVVLATCFFLRPGGCHFFPYSLDTSLAVASVTGALLFAAAKRDLLAGLLLLAALLSRPEIGLAGAGALLLERLVRRERPLLPLLLPIGAAGVIYLIVSAGTPLDVLKKEGWLTFLFLPPEFRSVYSSFAGVDRPAFRAAELALAAIALFAIGVWVLVAAIASARSRRASRAIEAVAVGVLAVVAFLALRPPESLRDFFGLLPPLVRAVPSLLFAGAIASFAMRLLRRERRTVLPGVPDAALLVALFFAARLFLAAGYVGPYNGFYLPLPLLVLAAATLRLLERAPENFGGAALSRITAGALAVFLAARAGALALAFRHPAWSEVTTPAGAVYITEPVADATRAALADLARRVPAGGELAGFPETGFLNWSLGLANPVAQDQFFPGHLDAAAEDEAIERLRRDPPAAIAYVDVLTVGHGPAAFGRDYLTRLDAFVRETSVPAASFGPGAGPDPRIGDPRFFVQIRVPR